MSFEQPDFNKVSDEKEARVGADAEKPFRDTAREKGLDLTPEEKAALDRVAEKKGEKAMQEYEAEKEKNPIEQLSGRIDKIAAAMRENGLEEDATEVEKVKQRLDKYANTIRENKEKLEEKLGKRVSAYELTNLFRALNYSPRDFNDIRHQVPVSLDIEGGTAAFFQPEGGIHLEDPKYLKDNPQVIEKRIAEGHEYVDHGLSKKGKTEFLRAIGILNTQQEVIDLPKVWEEKVRAEASPKSDLKNYVVDPRSYEAFFPTDVEGVNIKVSRGKEGRFSYATGKMREEIDLNFSDEAIDRILSQESEK